MSQLNGNGIPTNKTYGQVGDIYTDNNTNKKYKCALAFSSGKDQYYQWISLTCGLGEASGGIDLTSSSIMYIHVTSEEKDGETVYKSDKTYEEIKEAIDSGKSPVAIYRNTFVFSLKAYTSYEIIFANNGIGCIGITKNFEVVLICIPSIVVVTDVNTDVNLHINRDMLSGLPIDNIYEYYDKCTLLGQIPVIMLEHYVKGTDGYLLKYRNTLYLTGDDFAGITTINGNLTYCRLIMEDMSDTSTWEYTETEMPVNITDEHINTLIDKKLGVIENGTY